MMRGITTLRAGRSLISLNPTLAQREIANLRFGPLNALAYKIATGLVAQILSPVILHELRQTVAGNSHSSLVSHAQRATQPSSTTSACPVTKLAPEPDNRTGDFVGHAPSNPRASSPATEDRKARCSGVRHRRIDIEHAQHARIAPVDVVSVNHRACLVHACR